MKKFISSFWTYFKERTKSNPAIYILMTLYGLGCIGCSIYFMTIGNTRDWTACIAYLQIALVFYLLEYFLNVRAHLVYVIILIVFMTGNVTGSSFNVYTLIPCLDDILHAIWGVLFMLLGITVFRSLAGEYKNTKMFVLSLIFGFGFCTICSVFWEFAEFTADSTSLNLDMQEDTFVNSFHSFILYPEYDHLHTLQIDGIAYTVLYDADGNEIYRMNGYLDLGLYDTMWDLIWCTVVSAGMFVILLVERLLGKDLIYKLLVPQPAKTKEALPDLTEEEKTVA